MSSNVLLFPGRACDIVRHHKFHGHWPSNREVTWGGGQNLPPLALPDSEKPGLFRVKIYQIHVRCGGSLEQ